MLEACGLSKRYGGFTALDDLDLTIPGGEIFCLLGANGAGKSTTINLFLNFITPSAGEARVDGIDVTQDPIATKQRLAYIPENVALYPSLSGFENLRYLAALAGSWRYTDAELRAFLRKAGLQDDAHERRVAGYSKGMRQKVGIAVAIAKRAKALLLDEPTSGLDPKAAYDFGQLLVDLRSEGVAVLEATHDLFHAKEIADRVGIIRDGRLREVLLTDRITHSELEQIYLQHMHA